MNQLSLKSRIRDYTVEFHNSPSFLGDILKLQNSFIVIDKNVHELYKGSLLRGLGQNNVMLIKIHENMKVLDTVTDIYDAVIKQAPKKNMTLISIGGGITQDVTGFAASTLYRGIKWIYLPTTLLAQADSCIGAKTSLNYMNFKNLVGTFYPPSNIQIYTPFIKTLPDLDYFSGIGEIAKLLLIGGKNDAEYFLNSINGINSRDDKTVSNLTQKALLIKKNYIEDDEFDQGKRNMLNFGHCFGHAIESATNYAIPHGQGVIIGMILAGSVALKRKLLSPSVEEHIRKNMLMPVLKSDVNKLPSLTNKIVEGMKNDKKRTGQGIPLIMINSDYQMLRIDDLSEPEVTQAIKELPTKIAR